MLKENLKLRQTTIHGNTRIYFIFYRAYSYLNRCADRSSEVKTPNLSQEIISENRQTNRPTDRRTERRTHRKVSLPQSTFLCTFFIRINYCKSLTLFPQYVPFYGCSPSYCMRTFYINVFRSFHFTQAYITPVYTPCNHLINPTNPISSICDQIRQ